jgi:energy-coupling factor transporter ATP-binding protein EcfA2
MIQHAKFQNFKALRNVEITFDSRLTVLVGPNGSGKTSLLQGIHFLTQLAVGQPTDQEYDLSRVLGFSSLGAKKGSVSLEIVGTRSTSSDYRIIIDTSRPVHICGDLISNHDGKSQKWGTFSSYTNGKWHSSGRQDAFAPEDATRFDISAFIRFSSARLAAPTVIRSYPPQIGKDGIGLAATLGYIKSKFPERFDQIVDAFCRVIQGAAGVRFDKELVTDMGVFEDVLLIDFRGIKGIVASQVSSGTLFALGLLTVLLAPESPNVVLLDDLDHGLHPKAQMELVDVFRKLIEQNPNLQIIATSHSPYILDRLEWNEVKVTTLIDDGSAICVPLTDHPLYPKWKEAMSPGEFWSHLGDDWVKKPAPPEPTPTPEPAPVAS